MNKRGSYVGKCGAPTFPDRFNYYVRPLKAARPNLRPKTLREMIDLRAKMGDGLWSYALKVARSV